MLSAYEQTTEQQKRNAIFEINQQVILAGLYHGGFFDLAAFYGGTCLRIFNSGMDIISFSPTEGLIFDIYPCKVS